MKAALLPLVALMASVAVPAYAQTVDPADDEAEEVELTPAALGDALSCRSPAAAQAFAMTLFSKEDRPRWLREAKDDKDTKGMIGLYGYRLSQPALLVDTPVERVYFLKDWVVTLWPRTKAQAFIEAHGLKRAPIDITEQYYRFIDPETGPMLGAFEPTGGALAMMLAKAFGQELPPTPPSESLFVGCNYTLVSEDEFLTVSRQAAGIVDGVQDDIGKMVEDGRD